MLCTLGDVQVIPQKSNATGGAKGSRLPVAGQAYGDSPISRVFKMGV
jgi:hypothetical protein